jgi:dihydroflavonol-4-reductase
MSEKCLVTGANGHLGNNLVRGLLNQGKQQVRASVRDVSNTTPFEGLDCEVIFADMLDRDSLSKALQGIDTLYHPAAVFKHWAKDPQKEIIDPNLDGTRNVLEIAAQQGVKRIVYVSSIAALDRTVVPMNETGWNTNFSSPYNHAKTVSEKLAWDLAKELALWMVSVLPSSIIGPNAFRQLTPSMSFLNNVVKNPVRFNPNFTMNYVDVRDVVVGMIAASEKGKNGTRYILGNELPLSTTRVFELAHALFPEIQQPPPIPKAELIRIAAALETASQTSGEAPLLTVYNVELYYGADTRLDISTAKNDLGYVPRNPEEAIKETFMYLAKRDGNPK